MSSGTNEQQKGALEVVAYLAVIVLVVGRLVGGWNFNLPIAVILMVAIYAVLHDIRALSRLVTRDERAQSSDTMVPHRRSLRGGRS